MSTPIDRRRFLTYTGAAGAATGALWVAPSVLGTSSAFAAGSCNVKDQINWAAYTNGAMSTTGSATYTLNPDRVLGAGTPDYSVTMTVTPVGVVDSRAAKANVGSAYGNFAGVYELGMTGNLAGASSPYGWDVTFTWPSSRAAYKMSWFLAVIDESLTTPGYRDHAYLDSARSKGILDQDWLQGSGTASSPWTGHNGIADKTGNEANVTINDRLSTGVTAVTISYRGDPSYYGSYQSIGIPNLTWCL